MVLWYIHTPHSHALNAAHSCSQNELLTSSPYKCFIEDFSYALGLFLFFFFFMKLVNCMVATFCLVLDEVFKRCKIHAQCFIPLQHNATIWIGTTTFYSIFECAFVAKNVEKTAYAGLLSTIAMEILLLVIFELKVFGFYVIRSMVVNCQSLRVDSWYQSSMRREDANNVTNLDHTSQNQTA